MEKLNKVIRGLECCLNENMSCEKSCPYFKSYELDGCMDDLMAAALDVLRSGSGDLIRLSDLMKFPIRIDHYDKENGNEHFVYGVETVLEYAECLPRVEAEPVVHAYWIEHEDELGLSVKCSACHIETVGESPRCPVCGAHMDEEVADGLYCAK